MLRGKVQLTMKKAAYMYFNYLEIKLFLDESSVLRTTTVTIHINLEKNSD